MKHTIILPELPAVRNSHSMISAYAHCLLTLPVYNEDISVVCNDKLLKPYVSELLSNNPPMMGNKNGGFSGLFVVNDHVFMIVCTDIPISNAEQWIPYYSKHVSGFFVLFNRHSTAHIFDNCDVPVFILGLCPDSDLPMIFLEHDAHAKSMTCEKDISVFFRGRYQTRSARKHCAKLIEKNIPHSHIKNSHGAKLSGTQYVELMCRSKIAWCPRSVWSWPDHECNAVTGKEGDAMCLECLVIKHSIGIIEVEKRTPGIHFVQIKNDSSDLIEKLRYYLEHDDERKQIAHNGRLWWERNCSVIARAKSIFLNCLSAMDCKYEIW